MLELICHHVMTLWYVVWTWGGGSLMFLTNGLIVLDLVGNWWLSRIIEKDKVVGVGFAYLKFYHSIKNKMICQSSISQHIMHLFVHNIGTFHM